MSRSSDVRNLLAYNDGERLESDPVPETRDLFGDASWCGGANFDD